MPGGRQRPTEQSIRAMFRSNPSGHSVGLRLRSESGIFDIECDGAEGEDSYAKLMGGEIIATLGWSSRRGPHHVFRYDARLAAYGKSIIKFARIARIGNQDRGEREATAIELPAERLARMVSQGNGIIARSSRTRRKRCSRSWTPQ